MSSLTRVIQGVRSLIPDSAAAWIARKYFNQRFPSLGQMTTLQVDAANRKASLVLQLKGEAEPLHVTIDRYELTTTDGRTFVEIKEIHTSREWINYLAVELVKGRKFEVPEVVKALL